LRPFLSRQEVHHFLTAPALVTESHRALWYAVARVHTQDVALAVSITRTRIVGFSVTDKFWREVAGFFTRHPTSIAEMDDVIGYAAAARGADPDFSLSGRTLEALRGRIHEWQVFGSCIFHRRWPGSTLPNATYLYEGDYWELRQITAGADLAEEDKSMRHCVHTYVAACARGDCCIWSLRREQDGTFIRVATIELRGDAVVQYRGFANGAVTTSALAVIGLWASEYGIQFTQ